MKRGAFTRATRLLDEAGESTGDRDLVARIDITRAYAEAETGHAVQAIERCDRVFRTEGLAEETLGLAWAQLGLLHMRRGDRARGLAAFKQALALLAPGHAELGAVYLNRGNVHLASRDVEAAVEDFIRAREELSRVANPVEQAKAEHNLGYARLLTGDIVGALQMIDEAAPVLSAQSTAYRATVEQDRAEVMTAAGRPREAIRALESAATAYGSQRLRTFQADCELTLAWTLLREDPGRARVIARRAARHFRSQESPVPALRAEAAATVAEISAGGRTPSLLRGAEELAAQLRRNGHVRDAVLLQLQAARVEIARGQLEDARARLRAVRIDARSPIATRLLAREVRAELARARGDRRRARNHVRAGLSDLHEWQSSFGSLDLQSTLVGHGRALALQGLRLALDDGRPSLAFEWSERARALTSRVAPVRSPADAQVARDLTELRLLQGADQGQRSTHEARRVAELRARVRQRSWYGEGGGAVGEPAGLDVLQDALAECDAALVAHLVVDDRVSAVVVTADDARLVELGQAGPVRDRLDAIASDLTMAAAHRTGALAGPIRASLRAQLDEAADQLVRPLLPTLGERRVVLTPSGALAGTPWSLLPGLVGRPLSIPTSATRWLELRRAEAPPPRRVGLVAGPNLARAVEEVTRAAAEWPRAQVRCGPDATAAEISALAAQVDVLHLAGHGSHPGENPLFAAVELADGPWFGYDIDLLPSTPSTVVLSACELGRASVRSGEESVGMTAAWLHAGARSVLSSPVVIADDVACEALAHWHALVAGGQSPADALAEVSASADDVVPLLTFGAGW